MNRAAPEPKANMGKPEPRLDGRLKVTGEARYGSDFPVSDPAYAFLITSPIAKGRITNIDLAEAKAVPEVLEIFTYDNTKELKKVPFSGGGAGTTSSWQEMGPQIGCDGQIVGMVVADTFEAAREAAYRAKFTFAEEKPSATFDSPGVTEEDASKANERAKHLPQAGGAEAAIGSAEVKLEVEYGTPTQHHNAIELFTTTAVWKDGELTVYEPSQFVYGLKNGLAQKLGVAPETVHVVSPFVGGAFGSKSQLSPRSPLKSSTGRSSWWQRATRASLSRRTAPRRVIASAWARNATAKLPASATRAGKSPRGPIPIQWPASRTARGSTASAR